MILKEEVLLAIGLIKPGQVSAQFISSPYASELANLTRDDLKIQLEVQEELNELPKVVEQSPKIPVDIKMIKTKMFQKLLTFVRNKLKTSKQLEKMQRSITCCRRITSARHI